MPLIRIEFDNTKVSEEEALTLSKAAQTLVSSVTGIEDVFVYTNSSQIKIKVAPLEVFVEMSANKITNIEELTAKMKSALSAWKKDSGFKHPINLTLVPMNWKVEIDI